MAKISQPLQIPTSILDSISPTSLILVTIVSIQVGAGMATQLFPILGAEGTVAIRIIISACLLAIMA
jgi:inner membrane transporter RhtA